jgi:hypothetical protein
LSIRQFLTGYISSPGSRPINKRRVEVVPFHVRVAARKTSHVRERPDIISGALRERNQFIAATVLLTDDYNATRNAINFSRS